MSSDMQALVVEVGLAVAYIVFVTVCIIVDRRKPTENPCTEIELPKLDPDSVRHHRTCRRWAGSTSPCTCGVGS